MNTQNTLFTTLGIFLVLFILSKNYGIETLGATLGILIVINATLLAFKINRTARNFNDKPQLNK